MKKIKIEEVLVKPEYFSNLKQVNCINNNKTCFTTFLFLEHICGHGNHCDWGYKGKIFTELFDEKTFKILCEDYGIKIDFIEEKRTDYIRIGTDNSILSTYLNTTEKRLLETMGLVGTSIISGINVTKCLNSSFEKSVWMSLGYKVEGDKIIL